MVLISNDFQEKNLKKFNISIETKYLTNGKVVTINSNNPTSDDVINVIICEKKYYVNDKLFYDEHFFDSRIEYTFISKEFSNNTYQCPNCGVTLKTSDFINGCPYCKTHYNMDYVDKDLGSKYHYDLVLMNKTYRVVTLFFDVLVSFILSFIFIKYTSRTFNSYDIAKIFVYTLIMSLCLYYFFYLADAYLILPPIRRYKEKQNDKIKAFWQNFGYDKKKFFNNLNFEIRRKYYCNENIIDYDIIDYNEFNIVNIDGIESVRVKAFVRIVYYTGQKITSKYVDDEWTLMHIGDNINAYKGYPNIIKCPSCGASMDLLKGECEYCHKKIEHSIEWLLKD